MSNSFSPNPTVAELPAPLPGKTGWPWTEASPSLPDILPNGQPWPRISIVTPSYNQGQFIEETIRSVLLQGYPNLEYFVIDGGSRDNTVEVIRKYAKWLTYWVSEPDRGQSQAINKGFALATGSLLGWENSDDLLLPGSLHYLAETHIQYPDNVLVGNVIEFDDTGDIGLFKQWGLTFRNFVEFWTERYHWHMPGVFYGRSLLNQVGQLDEDLHYTFDMDLMCRLLQVSEVVYLPQPVARFRYHYASKTLAQFEKFLPEAITISRRYQPFVDHIDEHGLRPYYAERYAVRGLKLMMRGEIRPGLDWLHKSVKLSLLGVPRYLLKGVKKQIGTYMYRLYQKNGDTEKCQKSL